MSSSSTKSGNKPSNKMPFTADSIREYQPFQGLESNVQAKMCELLTSGMVGPKGNIKRPPNSYMLYRRHRFSEMTKLKGEKLSSNMRYKESLVRSEWNGSKAKKGEYSALAEHVQQEHNEKFPGYRFTPISERKWEGINEDGRKKWFFEFILLISTNIVQGCSEARASGPDIDEWIQDPVNHNYVSNEVLDEVLHGDKSTANTSRSRRGRPSRNATHPQSSPNAENQDTLREDENLTLPSFSENTIRPHLAGGPPHSATTGSASGTHGAPQDNPLSAQIISPIRIYYGSNTTENLAGFTGMAENRYFTSNDPPLVSGEFMPNEEQIQWDMSDMEGHNQYFTCNWGPYDMGQIEAHDQLVVTGSETTIDSVPVSGQGETVEPHITDSNAEQLYDNLDLMREFLNPFVLEDMDA